MILKDKHATVKRTDPLLNFVALSFKLPGFFYFQKAVKVTPLLLIATLLISGCNQNELTISLKVPVPSQLNNWSVNYDNSTFKSVYTSDHLMWASTTMGTLFYSNDNGDHWVMVKRGEGKSYGSLCKGDYLWAVYDHTQIAKSGDNGRTWKVCLTSPVWINSIFSSGRRVWVPGDNGKIYFSDNNGQDWYNQTLDLGAVYFIDGDKSGKNIWINGRNLLLSADTGKTWTDRSVNLPVKNQYFMRMCIDSTESKVLIADSYGNLYYSNDKGKLWKKSAALGKVVDVWCADGGLKNIYAIFQHQLFISQDTGRNWTFTGTDHLNTIWFNRTANTLWAEGDDHSILKMDLSSEKRQLKIADSLSIVTISNSKAGVLWGVAEGGKVVKSTDKGLTWTTIYQNKNLSLTKVIADDKDNLVWAVGKNGVIIKSVTGGTSWTREVTGTTTNLTDVAYDPLNNRICAIGNEGLVLSENKDKESLTLKYPAGGKNDLNQVIFFNGRYYIGGKNGALLSGSGDGNWQQLEFRQEPDIANIVGDSVENSLFISANTSDNVQLFSYDLKTGKSKEISIPAISQADDLLADNDGFQSKLWLLGEDEIEQNYILYSADGGENWTKEEVDAENILRTYERNDLFLIYRGTIQVSSPKSFLPSIESITVSPKRGKVGLSLKLSQYKSPGQLTPGKIVPRLFISRGKSNVFVGDSVSFDNSDDTLVYKCDFYPVDLGIQPGEFYYLKLNLSQQKFSQNYFVPKTFTYDPWGWVKANKGWLIPAGVLIFYYLLITLLWFFKPLLIFRISQKFPIDKLIGLCPSPLKEILSASFLLFPFSNFSESRRVVNAWSKIHYQSINLKFFENNSVMLRDNYVPIPVNYESASKIITEPKEDLIEEISSNDRNIIQVIGDGGSGKSTLSFKIAKWSIGRNEKLRIYSACIIIDSNVTNFPQTITELLTAWLPDEKVFPEWVILLLKYQNIICIVDGLSEQSLPMQDYINGLFGKVPANYLIVTARFRYSFSQQQSQILKPVPLTLDKLFYFISNYIQNKTEGLGKVYKDIPLPLSAFNEQLKFVERIGNLFKASENITPILITLIINNFFDDYYEKKIRNFDELIRNIPENIPFVFIQYLKNVNPTNPSSKNYLPEEIMLEIAKLLGYLSIRKTYLPHDIPFLLTQRILKRRYPRLSDPLQRFIDNQILTKIETLGIVRVRFNLDPCAEYMGAMYLSENITDKNLPKFKKSAFDGIDPNNEFYKVFQEITAKRTRIAS